MLTTRLLPLADWPRLTGTELESVWPILDPARAQIIVVADGDQIVACWALIDVAHVEGLWIAPTHRKRGKVLTRLIAAARAAARARGIRAVGTTACSAEVRGLLDHYGAVRVPGDSYVFPVEQEA